MKGCIVKIGDFLPVGGIEEYCRIIQKESKKIGIDLDIISVDIGANKNEIKERELMNGVKYTVYNIHNIDEFRNKLDEYESIILINSYVTTLTDIKTPESKNSILKECYAFYECYRDAKATNKIYQNHFGIERYTMKTPFAIEYILASDKAMGHSLDDDFYKMVKALGVPFEKIQLFTEFNVDKDKLVKEKTFKYIGRPSTVKGFQYVRRFSKPLAESGIRIEMHGMTRDASSYHNLIKFDNVAYLDEYKNDNPEIFAYGPYSKTEVNDILANAMFAYLPFKTSGKSYGDRFEIAQLEAIANGCVLILRKEQGESCKNKDGVRWIDIPHFAIWFDLKNLDKFVNEVIEISNNDKLRKKYVDTIYNYAIENFDIKNCTKHIEKMFEKVEKSECKISNEVFQKYNKYKFKEVINPMSILKGKIEKRVKQSFFEIED